MSAETSRHRYETLQIHAGQEPAQGIDGRAVPLYPTTDVFENGAFMKGRLQTKSSLAAAPVKGCRHD